MKLGSLLTILSISVVAAIHAVPASAQSSYVLTKLSSPFLGKGATASCIDEQHQVFGQAAYYQGEVFDWSAGFISVYNTRPVRWPASTASSVSPVKLAQLGGDTRYSPKCTWFTSGNVIVNVATSQQSYLPSYPLNEDGAVFYAPNDSGAAVWSGTYTEGLWTAGAGASRLPLGALLGLSVQPQLSNRGDVPASGYAGDHDTALLWADGQWQVIDDRPGVHSRALAVNENRQVLVQTTQGSVRRLALWRDGTLTPLQPAGDTRVMERAVLNNKGVVMGCLGTAGSSTCGATARAFIWRQGVLEDLTTVVKAKGASVPSGSVLAEVYAVNDAGSFVALMRGSLGGTSLVRLTARP